MSTAANMPTAAAILIGSMIIAAAVVLSVGRQPPPPSVSATTASAPAPRPEPAAAAITPRETVAQQAREALQYQSAALRSKCPSPANERNEFVLTLTFDAEGNEVAHGIGADLGNPQKELAGCISGALAPLRIPPPGATTMVEIPLSRR